MNKEITKTEISGPAKLLELAISKDVDIDKLKQLMDLQERWDAQQAKKSFLKAMSEFQSKCPDFKKGKQVDFTTKSGYRIRYNYTPLGVIIKGIKELLRECGLSFRWETKENGKISITCIVSHIDGHSESNTMTAEKDASGSKNSIQQIGSTTTYLQRYTVIGVFGITSVDTDVDGQKPKPKIQTKITNAASTELLNKSKIIIDEYTEHKGLQANYRGHMSDQLKAGMNQSDIDILKKYINAKNVSLKKGSQTKTIDLP